MQARRINLPSSYREGEGRTTTWKKAREIVKGRRVHSFFFFKHVVSIVIP